VIKRVRKIVLLPIEGAVSARPRGLATYGFARALLGWLGPFVAKRATDPLPPSGVYVVVTKDDFRILCHSTMADTFELGQWKKGTYRASSPPGGLFPRLDLELERLGRVRLFGGLRLYGPQTQQVFDLVVNSAAGPVSEGLPAGT
jgi:hypothetical protein